MHTLPENTAHMLAADATVKEDAAHGCAAVGEAAARTLQLLLSHSQFVPAFLLPDPACPPPLPTDASRLQLPLSSALQVAHTVPPILPPADMVLIPHLIEVNL